jgi:hypothetical protein
MVKLISASALLVALSFPAAAHSYPGGGGWHPGGGWHNPGGWGYHNGYSHRYLGGRWGVTSRDSCWVWRDGWFWVCPPPPPDE